jgi:hypothetical protein
MEGMLVTPIYQQKSSRHRSSLPYLTRTHRLRRRQDPDYSAAYCVLETSSGFSGHGLAFTLGRSTDLVVSALKYLATNVEGRALDSIVSDLEAFYLQVIGDTQFR